MTKRVLLAAAGAVALVIALATAAVTLANDDDRHPMMGRDGSGMSMMGDDDRTGDRTGDRMGDRMGGGRHGSASTSEPAYLVEMVAHHEEAVTTARELGRSDRPEMRDLGASIVESQTAQIELMRGWLNEWYPDAGPADYEPMMRDLDGLEGDELDRTFLEDMVGHHMMAVMMSQHLLMSTDVHPEVAELAGTIRDEQQREIVVMTQWLRDWFDASWSGHMR
ncbi:hypothetical protein NSZ01_22840 [Nocardioides szechwanensis]|uniref:Uncharacterized conserved protein, DUF305 family n=1 Tax=Nocardioides szechwanensis TaxID=1005944 RepID=A0A1H0IHX9_9ACTN|nr:DUF305 domain-containing protein [Nocardioides szechwanensis]GEP34516.1 hypothetical protein NSZ01_22840 [Nocardioides szechwanensis]SDO31044.1 Uncharacterized conserved protein, DUF305 family [Nocardioides szechwanensis]